MIIPPELIAAKNLVQWNILALPGVVGIGIGLREENGVLFNELAIRIDVSDKGTSLFHVGKLNSSFPVLR